MTNLAPDSTNRTLPGKWCKLTKRDLAMVSTMFGGTYSVTIFETQEGFWSMAVKFEGKQDLYSIETSRGVNKVWRSLAGAIEFAQESCPHAHDVFVEIGNWKLSRLKDHEARKVSHA
jgi:hypothetical protein